MIMNSLPGHLQLCLEALVEAGVFGEELPVARLQRTKLLLHQRQLRRLLGRLALKLQFFRNRARLN